MNIKYRNLLFGLLTVGLLYSCKQETTKTEQSNSATQTTATQENKDAEKENLPTTTYIVDSETHDFGKITEGEKVSHTFKIKNTGQNPLVINDVKPSCGCTTPNWTKDPIPPGNEGKIEVEFDSQGKSGNQSKTVTVTANADPKIKILKFTGEVVSAKK
ncbi:MAG: DUF1573 domain-containing protein [Bacteroidia bacterium]|nr:DUF1573 domain-containing protein [Bacteroidia bacterium]